jgi:rare lipoprotein A
MTGSGGWLTVAVALVCFFSGPADAGSQKQFSGVAAFYDHDYSGQTACGERYDPKKFTAAHRTLPFGTRLRVTNTQTHRSVVVTINDRGPFTEGRVLDLSLAAAKSLHMIDSGLVKVTATVQDSAAFTTAAKLQVR